VDQHGQPHRELDNIFASIKKAWSFAIRRWQQQQSDGDPDAPIGIGLEVSTESSRRRTLRQPQG
jgi:hypothetical protein